MCQVSDLSYWSKLLNAMCATNIGVSWMYMFSKVRQGSQRISKFNLYDCNVLGNLSVKQEVFTSVLRGFSCQTSCIFDLCIQFDTILLPRSQQQILFSVYDLFLLMLVLRIWCLLKSNDSLQLRCLFIYSHQLFTQHCIDTVRGIYSMIMHGIERVDWFIAQLSLSLCLQLRGGATMPVLCPFASI